MVFAVPLLVAFTPVTTAWVTQQSLKRRNCLWASDIIDAEFEPVKPEQQIEEPASLADPSLLSPTELQEKSLIDLALLSDPEISNSRVPFIDYTTRSEPSFIDVKLAFVSELDGTTYGIGVPFDTAVAVTIEKDTTEYLSPDDDDNLELMEIMAQQVQEQLGCQLQRTPRVLTVSGDLDTISNEWENKLKEGTIPIDDFLDHTDEDHNFFMDFMRDTLGKEQFEATLKSSENENNNNDDEVSQEILEAFDESIHVDETEMLDPQALFDKADDVLGMKKTQEEASGLRLISYMFPDDKAYSVVRLTKPVTLIARLEGEGSEDVYFELLSDDEVQLVAPRLEEANKEELENLGLPLSP